MPITASEIIARASELASTIGTDPHLSPLIDNEMTAETLLPHVFHYITTQTLNDPNRRQLLRQTVDVSFVAGSATVPTNLLGSTWQEVVLYPENQPEWGGRMSWLPLWFDFIRPKTAGLGYFSVDPSGNLRVIEPGSTFDLNNGATGTWKMSGFFVPAVGTTLSDPITLPDDLVDDVVAMLAAAMRGERPWRTFSDPETEKK